MLLEPKFGLVDLSKSKLLSWRMKITLYKVLVRPISLNACGQKPKRKRTI